LHAAMATGAPLAALEACEAAARRHNIRGAPAWLVGEYVISGLQHRAEFERAADQFSHGADRLDPQLTALLDPLRKP
jgi:predicted DsbA family dithiol-disulfide isomerase